MIMMKEIDRLAHKWSARFATLLAWVCCFYGFRTMEQRLESQILFAVPLLVFAFLTLL